MSFLGFSLLIEQYRCTADRILYNIRRKIKHIGSREEIKAPGVVVIGTVKGDLHDIGKNYRTASFLY
jgi:methanogenic corrinoid protein MtbC1